MKMVQVSMNCPEGDCYATIQIPATGSREVLAAFFRNSTVPMLETLVRKALQDNNKRVTIQLIASEFGEDK